MRSTPSPRSTGSAPATPTHAGSPQAPTPLAVQFARPPDQRFKATPPDADRLVAEQLAAAGNDRGAGMRPLVGVRPEHDHGGDATHLSSHARHPRPATSDKTRASQALARPTASRRVSSPPVGTLSSASHVTDATNHSSKPRSGRARPGRAG